jgi:hypothetical protein
MKRNASKHLQIQNKRKQNWSIIFILINQNKTKYIFFFGCQNKIRVKEPKQEQNQKF